LNSSPQTNRLVSSPKPERLLRIEVSTRCQYDCLFCCWDKNACSGGANDLILTRDDCIRLVTALTASGCSRLMLTGGEPLITLPPELLNMIKAFASNPKLTDFWITTNGASLRDGSFIQPLVDTGLRKLVVSITANDDQVYRSYTQRNINLRDVLAGIKMAVAAGIRVRVDVPITTCGIHNYADLKKLIALVREQGVRQLAYFKLHRTAENASRFASLYVNPAPITQAFQDDPTWSVTNLKNSQIAFIDGQFNVIVPTRPSIYTQSCKLSNCGYNCQGIYAAYLYRKDESLYLRACHNIFDDQRNEQNISDVFSDTMSLTNAFQTCWKYAYEN